MKYKITRKCAICQHLGSCRGTEIDCITCNEAIVFEETKLYSQEEYLNLLNRGDVFITKVDTE